MGTNEGSATGSNKMADDGKAGASGPVILMTTGQEGEMTVVRLDRSSQSKVKEEGPVYHVTDGQFKGIVVKQTPNEGGLLKIVKPHVRTWYYAYIRNQNKSGEDTNRERREVCFWFRLKTTREEKISQATEYFKRLIEPETFPRDYVAYIKKAMLLMQRFPKMRRIQLASCPDPEPMDDMDGFSIHPDSIGEEPPIENFITVLTPSVYDYQYLPEVPVSRKTHVAFRVHASADAHIALSHVYGDTDRRTYEIVLGGWNNTKSAIRYGGKGHVEVEQATPGLLKSDDFQAFWISWNDGSIHVGRGMTKGLNGFMSWENIPANKLHTINLMSVSTGPASEGRWEFVEYIAAVTPLSETRAAKRDKVRRGVVWYAKKTKMMDNLDEAFPSCLNTKQLLSLSSVRLTDMLEALVFLKDLLKLGLALEVSRGVWLRSPKHHTDASHETKTLSEMPRLSARDAPTVALVTTLFCEKEAVETMLEEKVSYVIHTTNAAGLDKTTVYTIGRMGDHRVVSLKLRKVPAGGGTKPSHANDINQLIGSFDQLQHVLFVGTGGAVPNYTEYDKHVKRGDVAVSIPRSSDAPIYIHCSDVEQSSPWEQAFFSTSVWNSPDEAIPKLLRQLYDVSVSRSIDKPSWDKYAEQAQETLKAHDDRFHRPPGKTDKLYAVLEGSDGKAVHVRHPVPSPDRQQAYRESTPNIRWGAIGSGRAVARSDTLRMEFAGCHGVVAYDRGLHYAVEAVMNSRVSSFAMVLGICDYVDGTKTRTWQPYAAVCAAAFTKALVLALPAYGGRRRGYYP